MNYSSITILQMMTNSTHELKTSMVQIYKCTLIIIARRNNQMLQAGKND